MVLFQTGATVRPKLYFAIGISGAVQHTVGMSHADVVVAINKDDKAPIFQFAHYGIVGDMFKIVPAITNEIRKRRTLFGIQLASTESSLPSEDSKTRVNVALERSEAK